MASMCARAEAKSALRENETSNEFAFLLVSLSLAIDKRLLEICFDEMNKTAKVKLNANIFIILIKFS